MRRLRSGRVVVLAALGASVVFAGTTGGAGAKSVSPAFLPPCPIGNPPPCVRFTSVAPVYWSSASSTAIHSLTIFISDATSSIVVKWLNSTGGPTGTAVSFVKTERQIVLRWHVEQVGVVPIPKASSAAHIRQNFDVFGFALSADEHAAINALGDSGGRLINGGMATDWDK